MKCCNTCAMLCENKDRKTPEGSELEWFSQENMDRLWQETRQRGEFLICHSTDPHAKKYGGEEKIKPGKETACIGFTLWIFMHIKVFELCAKGSYGKYRNMVGHNVAMDRHAMLNAAINMMTGSTGFGRSGPLKGMLIPQEMDEDRELRFPTGFEKVRKLFAKAFKPEPA